MNLNTYKIVNKLINYKYFPSIFRILFLTFLLFLVVTGYSINFIEGFDTKLFAKLNYQTVLIWGIWWPIMIFIAVFAGRIWCMVCPLEFVSSFAEKLSQKLKLPKYKLPLWIRGGIFSVLFYLTIQFLVFGKQLHRSPALTSKFMLSLIIVAFISGILFSYRSFCRFFCPIGSLLNLYSRGGMISVRQSEDASPTINNLLSKSCNTLLNPSKLDSNKDCLLCLDCVKVGKEGKMALFITPFFDKKNKRDNNVNIELTLFSIILTGFVFSEIIAEWKAVQHYFYYIPQNIINILNLIDLEGYVKGVWSLFIFPFCLWVIIWVFDIAINKKKEAIFYYWGRITLPIVILLSFAHLVKALAKLNSWSKYLIVSVSSNNFFEKLDYMKLNNNITQPILPIKYISYVGISLITLGLVISVKENRIINKGNYKPFFLILIYLLFLILIIGFGI